MRLLSLIVEGRREIEQKQTNKQTNKNELKLFYSVFLQRGAYPLFYEAGK